MCPVIFEYKYVNHKESNDLFKTTLHPLYTDLEYIYQVPSEEITFAGIYPYIDAYNSAKKNLRKLNKTMSESSTLLAQKYIGMLGDI